MSNTLVYSGVSKKTLAVIAITVGVLLVALIGIRYAAAVAPSDYGLKEGNMISAASSDDPDVYIVNDWGYKRLFLNPVIFGFYGQLTGGFAAVKNVTPATRDAFVTSGLFTDCQVGSVYNNGKVYGVETTGEDTGVLHWVNVTGAQAVAQDPNFFQKVFCINDNEYNWYAKSATDYTSVSQVPSYARVPGAPAPGVPGAVSVSLAPGNPVAATVTKNAQGVEYLRMRLSGTGTVSALTVKRLGAGSVDDFNNIYVYDGVKRLVSGKTLTTSTGEASFVNLGVSVNGTKDLSIVADMSAAAGGDVNYFQLTSLTLSSGTVSGVPVTGNLMNTAGASSGALAVDKDGSIPATVNVGQRNAQLSQFKITASTEAASIKRIRMINGGNVKDSDITNLVLKVDGNTVANGTISGGYVDFDLGNGLTIIKGANKIFYAYANVAGRVGETIKLYFESATDVLGVGDQYGFGMEVTLGATIDDATNTHVITLSGGALTLSFVGPTASDIGTDTNDTKFLEYTIAAAAAIELKQHRLTVCMDTSGDGYQDMTDSDGGDLEDIRMINASTGEILIDFGSGDSASWLADTASVNVCPGSKDGLSRTVTSTLDLAAGQVLDVAVTADVKSGNSGTVDLSTNGSLVKFILDGYGDLAGDDGTLTVAKYTGTNDAVKKAQIVPSGNISGPVMTVNTSSMTLGLAGSPVDSTYVKGQQGVDVVGLTFKASAASQLEVTRVTLTGYSGADADTLTTTSTGSLIDSVKIYDGTTDLMAAGAVITSNTLSTDGEVLFDLSGLSGGGWIISAGDTKTLTVKANLSTNTVPSDDTFAFDIVADGDVTAVNSSGDTVHAGNNTVNMGASDAATVAITVSDNGTITQAAGPNKPVTAALNWGQTGVMVNEVRFTSTNEAFNLEKLNFEAPVPTESAYAVANVAGVHLTYKNKYGSTLTANGTLNSTGSVSFGWSCTGSCIAGSSSDLRPYVPKDSNADIDVSIDLKTKAQGASQDVAFSIDLDGAASGFKAVAEGSGTVDTQSADLTGSNMRVYRVWPRFALVEAPTGEPIGTKDVLKFTIKAEGAPDSELIMDFSTVNYASLSFSVIASGQVGSHTSTFTLYEIDSGGNRKTLVVKTQDIDSATSATELAFQKDAASSGESSTVISGGYTKTYIVETQFNGFNDKSDYFQIKLPNTADYIRWSTNGSYVNNVVDVIKALPLNGSTFSKL